MAHIKYHDKSLGFNLEDIKFIKVKDMFTFYQKLLSEEIKIYDETNFISKHNLCILPSTKISDLFNFSKINVLGKHLIE
jgi:hypothetical protein